MTGDLLDLVLAGLAVASMMLIVAGRIQTLVRFIVIQGVFIALVPVLAHWGELDWRLLAVAGGNLAVKAVAFPWLLSWTARRINVRDQVEPLLNQALAVGVAAMFLIAALWMGTRLTPPDSVPSGLVVPVALFMVLAGLFLIIARRKALTQVAGYLVIENGIFTFGTAVAWEHSVVVELGVLLDVFAAIFVMGITVFQIARTFDSIDVGEMSQLRDSRRRTPAREMTE